MKRAIALLLVICMLGLALVACGKKKKDPTPTQKPTETETATGIYGEPELGNDDKDYNPMWYETLDFDGETLNIMVRNANEAIREWGSEDVEDDELGEAIYTRNEVVEGNLNVEVNLVPISFTNYDNLVSEITNAIMNDVDNKLHDFDIVAHFAYVASSLAIRDYHENLLNKDTFPYFNFGLRCWNQTIVNNTSVNDKMYFVAGDINISTFNNTIVMWHNLDLYDQVKKADDPENLQKLARSGFWTYSELYRWSSYVVKSGENVCDYQYGVEINTGKANGIPYDAVPAAFDVDYLITNADGTHKYNVVGNEKLEAALNDWRKIMNGEGNTSSEAVINACSCKFGTKSHFVDGKVLFTADILYRSKEYNLAMREMDDAYAILPMPKYNEEQTNYGTTPADSYTLLAVIDHAASTVPTKGEAVSAYLQYATEYSYLNVRQYYFYEVVETRYFGTDDSDGHVSDSISIFHEILDHIELTFAYVYSPMLNNYTWLWRDTLNGTNGDNTMASYYEANKDAFEDAVYDLDKWLGLVN